MFASYFVSPKDLWTLIGTARAGARARLRSIRCAVRRDAVCRGGAAQLARKGGVRGR